ncbi:M1-specific T cell receptor beta chain-like [Thunnus maccoyii]|uniref:M1-specific T cell receptor beta chain-like n=1 Tax=Thunnus maccoyii TaxID=8240 RepID=UPI001C4CC84D|nr:M1-specific T cell receptor beta chain-like [Thunnus maccoyii]
MIILILNIFFKTVLVSGASFSQVHQTPAEVYKSPGETAELRCVHSIPNYNQILWYKRSKTGQLQLLGYMLASAAFPEAGVSVKMNGSADTNEISTLRTEQLSPIGSAVYFCLVRRVNYEAYFGQGTKLTVLDPNITITPPTVKVLKPSKNECQNEEKKGEKKKTLVCVATGFYPDHVSVFWKIDGDDVTHGVATDNAAVQVGKYYRITSRLRVPLRKWFTEGMVFKCTVSFFNGNETVHRSGWISGIEGPGASTIRGKYLRITQNAKVTYVVLIFKSVIYGVFVVFLVLWLQGSSGKQNN